ncbi:MAG TPA: sigma-70 family RNA polymerase sigma factor [Actinomycetota bacterium]|nr:sigma-70 family RNA polymerase sigma factor [Actinomycetota bacterium]
MEARESRAFESDWPEIARWLKGALARRGVPFGAIDDVVQETGCRLYGMWDRVDATRSTRALALAIANNFMWDEHHRRVSPEPVEDLPEVPTDNDVEAAGIARLELARVRSALKEMNPSHQAVLLAEIGDAPAPELTPAALKMLRHRARKRLTVILESASASCAVLGLRLRDFSLRTQHVIRRYSVAFEAPTAGTVAAVAAAAITIGTAATPAVANRQPTTKLVSHTQKAMLVEGRHSDRDGWVHLRKTAMAPTRAKAPRTEYKPQTQQIHLAHQEGPVGTKAAVTWTPTNEGDDTIDPPNCDVTPGAEEVRVRCTADTGDQEYTIDLSTRLRP